MWAESDTDATPFAPFSSNFYPDFFVFWFLGVFGSHESTYSFAGWCIPRIIQSIKGHIRLQQIRALLQGIIRSLLFLMKVGIWNRIGPTIGL
jgi:hypothetical protein